MFFTRILCGVPKWKTPKPKKWHHKFTSSFRLRPVQNLMKCEACGSVHKLSTICLNCYYDIRVQTTEIKRAMMQYNPYLGERQKPYVEPRKVDSQTPASNPTTNTN